MFRRHRQEFHPPVSRGTDEDKLLQEFAIEFDGTRYLFAGYRYDRLSDAVGYAKLMRLRPGQAGRGTAVPDTAGPSVPTSEQREAMAELGIRSGGGFYHFAGYRYDRLQDAIVYARLSRRRGWA
jgi:hypothetical protein